MDLQTRENKISAVEPSADAPASNEHPLPGPAERSVSKSRSGFNVRRISCADMSRFDAIKDARNLSSRGELFEIAFREFFAAQSQPGFELTLAPKVDAEQVHTGTSAAVDTALYEEAMKNARRLRVSFAVYLQAALHWFVENTDNIDPVAVVPLSAHEREREETQHSAQSVLQVEDRGDDSELRRALDHLCYEVRTWTKSRIESAHERIQILADLYPATEPFDSTTRDMVVALCAVEERAIEAAKADEAHVCGFESEMRHRLLVAAGSREHAPAIGLTPVGRDVESAVLESSGTATELTVVEDAPKSDGSIASVAAEAGRTSENVEPALSIEVSTANAIAPLPTAQTTLVTAKEAIQYLGYKWAGWCAAHERFYSKRGPAWMPLPTTTAQHKGLPWWYNPEVLFDLRDITRLKELATLPAPSADAACVTGREAVKMLGLRRSAWVDAMVAFHVVRNKGDDPFRSLAWMPTSVDAKSPAFTRRKWVRDLSARFAVADIERLRRGMAQRDLADAGKAEPTILLTGAPTYRQDVEAAVEETAVEPGDTPESRPDVEEHPERVTCVRDDRRRARSIAQNIGQAGWRPSKWWRKIPYNDMGTHYQVMAILDGTEAIAAALGTAEMSLTEIKQALPAFEDNVRKMFGQVDQDGLWFGADDALMNILDNQLDSEGYSVFTRVEEGCYRVATPADREAESKLPRAA